MQGSMKFGYIALVNDPVTEATNYYNAQNPQNTRLFCANELNVETARAIIDESYIANDATKTILIAALSFNIYAQNALLKVLEEPPSGIVFILYAKMKSLLLPTIRSRLPIVSRITREKLPPFALSVQTLNLDAICQFLKQREKDFDNSHLKIEIQSLYKDCIAYGLRFSLKETMFFEKAIAWESRYESPQYVLLVLLLLVLRKKKQQFQEKIMH